MRTPVRRTLAALHLLCLPFLYGQTIPHQERGSGQYSVVLRMPLTKGANGVDGELVLLDDARLTPKLLDLMWGTGGIDIDDDPALAIFKNDLPHNAVIQIMARDGSVVDRLELERALVKLQTTKLYGNSKITYLVMVDYWLGLVLILGLSRFRWKSVTDTCVGLKQLKQRLDIPSRLRLMNSLKTVWKFVDSADGKGKLILHAACRPDFNSKAKDDSAFTITYTRYYFDGTKWMYVDRKVQGFSEFEEGFPRSQTLSMISSFEIQA